MNRLDGKVALMGGDALDALRRTRRRFLAIRVEPYPIFVRDGAIWTSAGVTATIDLALALVEDDVARSLALAWRATWSCSSNARAGKCRSEYGGPSDCHGPGSSRRLASPPRLQPDTLRDSIALEG